MYQIENMGKKALRSKWGECMKLFRCTICEEPMLLPEEARCQFCGAGKNFVIAAHRWSPLKIIALTEKSKKNLRVLLVRKNFLNRFYEQASQRAKDDAEALFQYGARIQKKHQSIVGDILKGYIPELEQKVAVSLSNKENLERLRDYEKENLSLFHEFEIQSGEKKQASYFAA
jgi:hypothetical protein